MGWLTIDSVNAEEYYQDEDAVRQLLAEEIEYSQSQNSARIIDIEIIIHSDAPSEAEVYLAIEQIEGTRKTVTATACALSNQVAQKIMESNTAGFAWKEIPESFAPVMSNCPPRILDQLTPTSDTTSLAWRIRCREEYIANLRVAVMTAETEPHSITLEQGQSIEDFIEDIRAEIDDQRKTLEIAQTELDLLGGPPISMDDLIGEQIRAGHFIRISALSIDDDTVHVLFQGLGTEGKPTIIGRYMKPEIYDGLPKNTVTTLDMYETLGPLEVAPNTFPDGSTTKRERQRK
jgi:hypothetical protein